MRKKVLIAGGSGLVGKQLQAVLKEHSFDVSVLSRNPKEPQECFWDPSRKEIDSTCLADVQVLINLSGAGVADEKWTDQRKRVLQESRVGTNAFLLELAPQMPHLEHFICASGINAYGFKDDHRTYTEEDGYGNDFLSQLVKVWELSAQRFSTVCPVTILRIGVVMSSKGGALDKMTPAVRYGMGSPLGSGKQMVPWIHLTDLCHLFYHVIDHNISGTFNAIAGQVTNAALMKGIAATLQKPFWAPNVPSFVLRAMFGEMSLVLLKGVTASNEKVKKTGFNFHFEELNAALKDLLAR
jgi:uncharacterized protein (TIGR01777 family)